METHEIEALLLIADAGIRASGLQVFSNNNGAALQSALNKLQNMANDLAKEDAEAEE